MGGLLVIVTVAVITIALNWERRFTWVPIGVMLLAALLGGVDDMLNTFGQERRSRSLSQTLTLIRVHKSIWVRVWLFITLPWATFKRLVMRFGSKPGKGVHVHEKLLLQFLAGAISAWWIYWKLGDTWQLLYIPFFSFVDIGILIVPLIILVVMFTANAVNISDGMDGLAGGMLIPTFGALAFLSWVSGYDNLAILNTTTAGALLTYTYFNIKPARFQMGDVGSLGLGALLAINALATNKMAVLILLAFVFYIEAFSVIIQVLGRYFLGKRIFRMAPLHHHFELKGWSEEKTIMRFWVIHCFFVVVGVWVGLH
jgi:phospho-N-acetylmuramoyl-pentapeptide-transferase